MILTAFYQLKENKKQGFTKIFIFDPISGNIETSIIDMLKNENNFYYYLVNELKNKMSYKNFEFKFYNVEAIK